MTVNSVLHTWKFCLIDSLCSWVASSFSKLSVTSPMPQLILQPFPHFTYITAHSPTLPLLHLRHSSFSNPSFASPASQDFHLRHLVSRPWSFVEPGTEQIQELSSLVVPHSPSFVTAHSPTLPSLYLRHSSFSNTSAALPTSQLILQPFRCFAYVTAHSPTLLSLLRHRIFS